MQGEGRWLRLVALPLFLSRIFKEDETFLLFPDTLDVSQPLRRGPSTLRPAQPQPHHPAPRWRATQSTVSKWTNKICGLFGVGSGV